MHLSQIHSDGPIKRFDSLHLVDLPEAAKVIFLIGPNGCGKSSVFDAILLWHHEHGRNAGGWDSDFYLPPGRAREGSLRVEFHEPTPTDPRALKALFHYRSAYRYTSRFQVGGLTALPPLEDSKEVNKSIDDDRGVEQHYARLWGKLVEVSGDRNHSHDLNVIHTEVVDPIANSFNRLFPEIQLESVGQPFQGRGTFYFTKKHVKGFSYVNLSAGEKAAFDLLLDAHLRSFEFPGLVFLLDEPESHINARVQATILDELLTIGPKHGQFVIATHSLSMMRRGMQLASERPGQVAFLNFDGITDSFNPNLSPSAPTRQLWRSIHKTSLEDLADLVSPDILYLVEGSIDSAAAQDKQQFDARVLNKIFGDIYPEVDFQSIGNSGQVKRIGQALQNSSAIRSEIRRIVDRDDKTEDEVSALEAEGTRVWSQRELENYLLSDEILGKLCAAFEPDENARSVVLSKLISIRDTTSTTGSRVDDYKAKLSNVFRQAKASLQGMTRPGSTPFEFATSVLAPLVTRDTAQFIRMADELGLPSRQ